MEALYNIKIRPLRVAQPALITIVVTISSPRVVEAVRKSASSTSSAVRSYKSGIVRGAGPASTNGLDLGAFSRRKWRKISPFTFRSKAILLSSVGSLSKGSLN